MFRREETEKYLITGLGNPGEKYSCTRHNAGFMALDYIAEKTDAVKKSSRFSGEMYLADIGGKSTFLLKPSTFMNLSGDAVEKVMHYYKIPIENLIVISDDISLPVGKIRIRKSGSHGGPNGLRDIIEKLGSSDFKRIKIGVGEKPHPDMDLADWVLSRFKSDEIETLSSEWESVLSAAKLMLRGKTDEAMNKFN